jgi:pimeloyl-ACP methyl ester carboxylesterase
MTPPGPDGPLSPTAVSVPGWGIKTEVLRGGRGDPVVLLHGDLPPSPADPLAAALARRHEVLVPVQPGFRHPDDARPLHDVHDLALYHDDLLGALGLGPVPVVGHSFGGMVAAELAAHVPGRASRLCLIAPYGLWRDDEPVADLLAAFPLELAPLLWADPTGEAAVQAMADLPAMLPGLATVGRFLWPLPDKGLSRRLHRITAPTLAVWGDEDRLVPPSYAADLAGRIPRCRTELVAGAGHMVPVERPDQVARLIEELLG